jgi:hypothetical protein
MPHDDDGGAPAPPGKLKTSVHVELPEFMPLGRLDLKVTVPDGGVVANSLDSRVTEQVPGLPAGMGSGQFKTMFGVFFDDPAAGTLTCVWPDPARNVGARGSPTVPLLCRGYCAVMVSLRVAKPAPVGVYVWLQVDWFTGAPGAVFRTREHPELANPLWREE